MSNLRAKGSYRVSERKEGCLTSSLITTATLACFSTSFVFGYGLGSPSQYHKQIENLLFPPSISPGSNVSIVNPLNSTESLTNFFIEKATYSLHFILFLLGGFVASVLMPHLVKLTKLTRKQSFYLIYIIGLGSAVMMYFSWDKQSTQLLYAARFFQGFVSGSSNVITPAYLHEISPLSITGQIAAFHPIFIAIGILTGEIIGLPQICATENLWGFGMSAYVVCFITGIIFGYFLPDSPIILCRFGKEEKARKALEKLRSSDDVSEELEETKDSLNALEGKVSDLIKNKNMLTGPVVITLILFGIHAMGGINAIMFFSSTVFESASIPSHQIPIAAVGIGLVQVVCSIVVLPMLYAVGRRNILIGSLIGQSVCLILFSILCEIMLNFASRIIGRVCIFLMLTYVACFCFGPATIAFVYTNEIFPSQTRSIALGLGMAFNYICNLLIVLLFPITQGIIGNMSFILFAIIILCVVAYLSSNMPETKDQPFEALEDYWHLRCKAVNY